MSGVVVVPVVDLVLEICAAHASVDLDASWCRILAIFISLNASFAFVSPCFVAEP